MHGGQEPRSSIDDEQDDIGFFDGELRLNAHLFEQDIGRFWLKSARIDDRKPVIAPFGRAIVAVARHARRVFDDRRPCSQKAVK